MIQICPGVLKHGTHLNFKAVRQALRRADIVQGDISKAVYIMYFALVY